MDPIHLFASNENHLFCSSSFFSLALPEPLRCLHISSSSPHCPNACPVSPPDSPWGNHLSIRPFLVLFFWGTQSSAGRSLAARGWLSGLAWVLTCPHLVLFPHLPTCSAFLFPLIIWLSLMLVLFRMLWLPLHFWLFFLIDFSFILCIYIIFSLSLDFQLSFVFTVEFFLLR